MCEYNIHASIGKSLLYFDDLFGDNVRTVRTDIQRYVQILCVQSICRKMYCFKMFFVGVLLGKKEIYWFMLYLLQSMDDININTQIESNRS